MSKKELIQSEFLKEVKALACKWHTALKTNDKEKS